MNDFYEPENTDLQQPTAVIDHVRRLLFKFGWNTTCFQIVNPGMEYWFGDDGESVVAYISTKHARVVAGAPVCSRSSLSDVAFKFEKDSAANDKKVCYFGAESRLEAVYDGSTSHSMLLLGAQPVWDPENWDRIVRSNSSLRSQLNRARNKGVTVREWTDYEAHNNPLLRQCLDQWLETKGLPPLHFVIETETLERLTGRRVFVAERKSEIVGFLILSPIPTREGWLTEQFPHSPMAPNGTVELMMDTAFRKLTEDGAKYITLGLSPLSKRSIPPNYTEPFWLKVFLAWMKKHGKRFYNFDGLDAFKAKMSPNGWEPIFAISNEERFSGGTLYSIGLAFTDNKPLRVAGKGLVRAAATELRWFKQRFF